MNIPYIPVNVDPTPEQVAEREVKRKLRPVFRTVGDREEWLSKLVACKEVGPASFDYQHMVSVALAAIDMDSPEEALKNLMYFIFTPKGCYRA
jgi:hypothetical protein